ncbi:hypothetical protein SUDANB126_06188 [Streptomyces sp. enrichment culture]
MTARREVCAAFGSKPSRTRDSAEAPARRAPTGAGLPRTDPLVDLRDAVSAARLIPVGGEDADRTRAGRGSCGPPARRTS